jgi:hypothetical protein
MFRHIEPEQGVWSEDTSDECSVHSMASARQEFPEEQAKSQITSTIRGRLHGGRALMFQSLGTDSRGGAWGMRIRMHLHRGK